ncbi:hypothetical protein DL766_004538 [Monosporascus sp. MC13-8B]|nr:hypothetical protein DL763_005726 [Monosporascus cannonballus]RYP31108.1 hypothetical protein DL766_004538 [Monosporascus sp. MC13-8B]
MDITPYVRDDQLIFTRGDLERIEEQLAQDNRHIQLGAFLDGELFSQPNPNRGLGTADPLPGEKRKQLFVRFNGERKLRKASGPKKSQASTRREMKRIVDEWGASEECANLVNALKSSTLSHRIDKVTGFGMGVIASDSDDLAKTHMREHAVAPTIAKAIEEMGDQSVAVCSQEPQCTSVCGRVLEEEFGIQVIEGFGARGFTLVDDRTFVLAHTSSICVREIVADLARPAGMCWRRSATPAQIRNMDDLRWDVRADIDTTRSENMMRGYSRIPGARVSSILPNNGWPYHDMRLNYCA